MVVKRIVANIPTDAVEVVRIFYAGLLDLEVVMDLGWIATLASGQKAPCQISIASEGGSGAAVPDLTIEVDDVDAVYARAKHMGLVIDYDLTDEPWGTRRFFVADPTGKLLNISAHITPKAT